MAAEGSYYREPTLKEWAFLFLRPRYLSLGIHAFLAFYVGFKFLFLVFNATSPLERWVFELTPLFLLGYQELQLALFSAALVLANAYLHLSRPRFDRLAGLVLTGTMVASLILALRTSPYYFDAVNIPRLAVLGALLFTIPLDHLGLLQRRARQEVYAPPEATMWGPEPAAFDQAMGTLDDALASLDSTVSEAGPEETTDVATSLLEGLLSDFDGLESAPEEAELGRREAIFENRLKSIEERLAVDAQDPDALFAKATYLAMQKKYEEALDLLDQVGVVNDAYPGLWYFKARVYELMGNLQMAELTLQRAGEQD